MERVTGIGGLFFRARSPAALADWYEQHLGISRVPERYDDGSWWQEAGPTVFDPFNETNEFLARFDRPLILNFRVRDLDAMVAQLRAARIAVEVDPTRYPNGIFAHLHDPEGNPIQLWQAEGTDATPPRRA